MKRISKVLKKLYRVIKLLMEIEIEESGEVIEIKIRGVELKIEPKEVEVRFSGLILLEPKYLSMCLRAGIKTEEEREEAEEKIRRLRWLIENEENESEEKDRRDREEEGMEGGGGCRVPVRVL